MREIYYISVGFIHIIYFTRESEVIAVVALAINLLLLSLIEYTETRVHAPRSVSSKSNSLDGRQHLGMCAIRLFGSTVILIMLYISANDYIKLLFTITFVHFLVATPTLLLCDYTLYLLDSVYGFVDLNMTPSSYIYSSYIYQARTVDENLCLY